MLTAARARDLRVEPIPRADAVAAVRRWHYSGKVDPRSQVHLGIFLGGRLLGAMQFGPPIDRRKVLPLVKGAPWSSVLELNRLAFSDELPRNSESRALGVAVRMLRRYAPHVGWVLSYADAAQCGDGAIYRAAGFLLTAIRPNTSLWRMPDGEVVAEITLRMAAGPDSVAARYGKAPGESSRGFLRRVGASALPGFQLRYIRFLDPSWRDRLTVPVLPYSAIDDAGARMARGERAAEPTSVGTGDQPGQGGATPTRPLHNPGGEA